MKQSVTRYGRLEYITNLRVLAILDVVLFHCLSYYGSWGINGAIQVQTYSFITGVQYYMNIPLLFMISGYLFAYQIISKQKNINRWAAIRSKAKRLLWPFFFWGFVSWLLWSKFSIFTWFVFRGASHLWFLGTLFIMFGPLILFLHRWSVSSMKTDNIVLFLLFLLYVFHIKYPIPFFVMDQVFRYSLSFYFGVYTFKHYNMFVREFQNRGGTI